MTLSHSILPLEIVDNILNHAHDDLSLLTSCSLVCKSWFPSARYHIFSTVSLRPENAHAFFHLFLDESSTISHFITHVDAKDTYEDDRWISLLFPCLSRVQALKSVSIASSFDTPLSDATLFTLGSFDMLVELKIVECAFARFRDVKVLLGSLRVLEKVHLEADWLEVSYARDEEQEEDGEEEEEEEMLPPSNLREVYLRCEVSHVLKWFMAAEAAVVSTSPRAIIAPLNRPRRVAPVSKLTFHGIDADDLPVVTRYLRHLGSALTHLTIYPSGSLYDALCSHLDLSIHPNLRYLKLVIDCDSSNLLMARDVLKQVGSSSSWSELREIELSFYSIRQVSKTAEQWASLDRLLAEQRFAKLERVTVSATIAAVMARKTLPLCEERGVLDVVYQ